MNSGSRGRLFERVISRLLPLVSELGIGELFGSKMASWLMDGQCNSGVKEILCAQILPKPQRAHWSLLHSRARI